MGLTRYVLKRPVTTILALLCILVFGISSVFSATLEQMPDTDQPMLIVRASYSGAAPEDMDELVTKPIEDQVSQLEGVKSMSSTSNEGNAMIMLEYDYEADMDEAWRTLMLAQHHDSWIVPYNGLNRKGTWADQIKRWTDSTNHIADGIIEASIHG